MGAAVGLGLFADWEVGVPAYGAWVDAATVNDALLAPLRATGELAIATHYWVDDVEPHALGSLDELAAMATTWRQETVALYAGDLDAPNWRFQFGLHRTGVRISLQLAPAHVGVDTRDHLERLIRQWATALAPATCVLALGIVVPTHAQYRRVMPPRDSRWTLGALDYFLGRAWHAGDDTRAAALAAMVTAPLPLRAVRTDHGDVVRVGFPADLDDASAVAAARTTGEGWLVPLVPTTNERGWNDAGDKLVVATTRAALEPFTFYDPRDQVGYKALIVDPDTAEVDEAMWATLVDIARATRTPDGTPVATIRLIFPVRDLALAMYARVVADGFEMSTYPTDAGYWQVNPPFESGD